MGAKPRDSRQPIYPHFVFTEVHYLFWFRVLCILAPKLDWTRYRKEQEAKLGTLSASSTPQPNTSWQRHPTISHLWFAGFHFASIIINTVICWNRPEVLFRSGKSDVHAYERMLSHRATIRCSVHISERIRVKRDKGVCPHPCLSSP